MTGAEIEVVEPDGSTRRWVLSGPVEVGREGDGLVVRDPSVSRRHLRLEPIPGDDRVGLTDLGSTYGTWVNGHRIAAPVAISTADVVVLGETQLRVTAPAGAADAPPAPGAPPAATAPPAPPAPMTPPAPPAPMTPPSEPAATTPEPPAEGTLEGAGIEVTFAPGTPGEGAAKAVLADAERARRRLAGFGTEAMGGRVRIRLTGPIADPANPERLVAGGTVVDAAAAEIWMVVTPESPPEPAGRPLALVFAAGLPAAAELSWLIEGYATSLTVDQPGDQPVDAVLATVTMPPLAVAEGELAAAMAASFAGFLVRSRGDAAFRRVLAEARPGGVDAAFAAVYGSTLAELESEWRDQLSGGRADRTSLVRFLRLSWRHLRPHWRRQAEIFALMLVGLGFTVALPFATRRLFDVALPSGEMSQVLALLGALLVVFAISLLAGLRRSYLSGYVSGAIVRDVRNDMFGRLQHLPTSWYRSLSQGDVLTRMFSDVSVVEDGLSSTLREGTFQVLSLLVAAAVLVTLSPVLALVVLVGAPAVALVYKRMGAGARARSIEVQERTGALVEVSAENHAAEQVVKVFGLQRREIGRFHEAAERLFRSERRLGLWGGIFGLAVNSIVTMLRIVVLALGSWMVIDGRLTIGTLVAFLGVMGEVVGPVTTLTTIGQNLQAASGALSRIEQILLTPGEPVDAGEALPPLRQAIRFEGVRFGYGDGPLALDGVDLEIRRGTRVAVVGPSGSGKSTVLRLLMRLHDPDEGRIAYDDVDVRRASPAALRRRLGVVFQDSFLFEGSIRDNIALANPDAGPDAVEAAARAAELDPVIAVLPDGLDTRVGPGGANLSGGQRQRVAIARALVRDPDILVLDEATSALDPQTERQLAATLDRVAQGRTTVAVTHRLASVRDYDQIVVVDRGRVAAQGTHDELLASSDLYAALWAEQTGGVVVGLARGLDAAAALGKTPPFEGLDDEILRAVADAMAPVELSDGDVLTERPGRIHVVTAGRAELVQPGVGGPVVVTELGPGATFGISALLGEPTGGELRARGRVALAALAEDDLAALAERFPALGRALAPVPVRAPVRPAGARRLTRLTATVSMAAPITPAVTGALGAEDRDADVAVGGR